MALFEEGNKWWQKRTKHGRDKLFQDPKLLWESACEYFEATDKRKWVKKDWVGKDAEEVERENETPYTKSGLALYLDCDWRTIEALKSDTNPDFAHIISRIEKIIYTQKFEGAAVGAFNANIIARELGLSEKVESDNKNKNETNISLNLTPEKIKEISQHLHKTV